MTQQDVDWALAQGLPVSTNGASTAEAAWPPLLQLREGRPSAPSLPAEMVPEPFRPWLVDIASGACIPLESVVCPTLIGVGSLIGRSVGIRPGKYDDYIVVPNLWGGIIARPGAMKTYAIQEGTKPLSRLAAESRDTHQAELDLYGAEKERITAEINAIKTEMSKAAKADREAFETSETSIVERSTAIMAGLETELATKYEELRASAVTERRYITQDATVEKLGELLNENPRGLLVLRDELAGWLRLLDKSGREGDREFYLESWNGTGGYTFDRIGRGTVHVDALTISICGGIQPGKLMSYIDEAIDGNAGADGLLQRLQLIVWPDGWGEWAKPESWPDPDAKNRAFEIFRYLDRLDASAVGAESTDGDGAIPCLRFSPDAQEIHDSWRDELEHRLRSDALIDTPAFESHLSKYRSLMPSLALIFHLVDVASGTPGGPVTAWSTRLAAAWCDYLEAHAKKVYAAELFPGVEAAHNLSVKIKQGAIVDGQTTRDIYQHHWSGLTTSSQVATALGVLANALG